jgi:hypothetical protein
MVNKVVSKLATPIVCVAPMKLRRSQAGIKFVCGWFSIKPIVPMFLPGKSLCGASYLGMAHTFTFPPPTSVIGLRRSGTASHDPKFCWDMH